MEVGFYFGLVCRVSKLFGRRVVVYEQLYPYPDYLAFFEGISDGYVFQSTHYRLLSSNECDDRVEDACRELLERFFVYDGNPKDGVRWFWIDSPKIDYLVSKTFQELDLKLTFSGV